MDERQNMWYQGFGNDRNKIVGAIDGDVYEDIVTGHLFQYNSSNKAPCTKSNWFPTSRSAINMRHML
jgi:hypothetical protein